VPRSQVDIDVLTHLGTAISELGRMQQAMAGVGVESGKTGSKLDSMKKSMEQMAPQARRVFATASAAIGGATAAFASYETQLKNVQNISGQTDAQMAQMTQRFMALPPTLGEADDLMRALYQTISSGITGTEDAFGVVVNSAKAARGNLADMAQTVDGLTSILNAYGIEAAESEKILDSMTKTVDLGKLTFGELADNIGKGISIAAAADVGYNELLGTLATLTLNGLSVEESMTSIRNILNTVLNPSKEVSDTMEQLGFDFSVSALKAEGLGGMMARVADEIQGNSELVTMFFPNIRAMNGAMALASEEGGAKLAETFEALNNSAGKVQSNFENMSDTTAATMDALLAELKKVGVEFGAIAAEYVVPLVRSMTELLNEFKNMDEDSKRLILQLTGLSAALAGIVLVLPKLISGYQMMASGLVSIQSGLTAASAGTATFGAALGPALAAVVAINAALILYTKHLNDSADAAMAAAGAYERDMEALGVAAESAGFKVSELVQEFRNQSGQTEASAQELIAYIRQLDKTGKAQGRWATIVQVFNDVANDSVDATADLTDAGAELADQSEDTAEKRLQLVDAEEAAKEAAKKAKEEQEKLNKKIEEATRYNRGLGLELTDLRTEYQILDPAIDYTAESQSGLNREMDTAVVRVLSLDGGMAALALSTVGAAGAMAGLGEELTDAQRWDAAFGEIADTLENSLGLGVMNALFDGFETFGEGLESIVGEWADAFSKVWEEKVFRGEGFTALLTGGMSISDFAGSFADSAAENPWAFGLGGAASIYQGTQQGGASGALMGAIGGASMWASLAPLLTGAAATGWGLAIAAVIGGGIALFGNQGQETPWFSAMYGDPMGLTGAEGFRVSDSGGHMGFDDESREVFNQQMNALIDDTRSAWRDALLLFEDADLFDSLAGDLPATFFGHMEMSTQEFAQYFGEVWLPEQMTNIFRPAIDTALSGTYAVTQSTLDRLWEELGDLPGPERIDSLIAYISAVKGGAELLADLDWDVMAEQIAQTPRDAFVQAMTGSLEEIDLAMLGFDQMSLIEQAQQAQDIQQLITAARETEIRYLQQIEQISAGIADSIGAQIESLQLGGMTEFQQADYAAQQLEEIFATLMAGGLSPDTVQQLVGDAQGYIDLLAGVMGDEGLSGRMSEILVDFFGTSALGDLGELFPGGFPASMTGREFLVALLEQLGTVSESALEEARQEAQAINQEYIDRLTEINERLTGFDGGLKNLTDEGGSIDATVETFDALGESSSYLADEFERITSALNGWDPEALAQAIGDRVVVDIDPNLAPFIELVETIVAARTGGGGFGGPLGGLQ
jgi:TP901 family phage tail tape measure protein